MLLTGPARGYVRGELERLGDPLPARALARSRTSSAAPTTRSTCTSCRLGRRAGPKAVLESLATGVPLVTTRVGQAQELVEDGRNGLLVDVEDVRCARRAALRVHADAALAASFREAGRATAEPYALEQLDEKWAALFDGFVSRAD